MPDVKDLHEAFASLEREIPDHYRSPVIADRMAGLLDRSGQHGRRRSATIATSLLAAAAVAALAVGITSLSHRSTRSPGIGHQPTTSHSVSVPPPPQHTSANPSPSTHTSVTKDGVPTSRAALIAYVRGGHTVTLSAYQQAEPGPGQPMRPFPGLAEFNTPSGNITCTISDDVIKNPTSAAMSCLAQQGPVIPPKPASCQMDWAGYFGFSTRGGGVTIGACVGGPSFGPTTQVLAYGSSIQQTGIRCRSESGFLACADLNTGHGFAVNRDMIKTY